MGTLTRRAAQALYRRLRPLADSRPADFVVGGREDPYLRRWWVIPRNRFFNIYLHEFRRPDDDRALHDHPYASMSLVLDGTYIEHMPGGQHRPNRMVYRFAGAVICRRPSDLHRIALETDYARPRLAKVEGGAVVAGFEFKRCWSLFITGPRVRDWGFACPKGWVPWQQFVAKNDKGGIGRGCGE